MAERRTEILDAALRVLAEQGMRGLTHRAVDAAAGIAPGSTSYYFRSRSALVEGCVTRLVEIDESEVPAVPSADLVETAVAVAVAMATTGRYRTLARYELSLAAAREPGLRAALVTGGDAIRALAAHALAAAAAPGLAAAAAGLAAGAAGLAAGAAGLAAGADPAVAGADPAVADADPAVAGADSAADADPAVAGADSAADADPVVAGAVDPAVAGAVDPAVAGAVDPAVAGAVDPAVAGAVDPAVAGADLAAAADELAALLDGLVFTALVRGPHEPAALAAWVRPPLERALRTWVGR